MSILDFILLCVIVGFVLWLVIKFIPMDETIKKFLPVAVVVILVIVFLRLIGVVPFLDAPIPRIR